MSTRARFIGRSARFLPHGTEGRAEEIERPDYAFQPDGVGAVFKVREKELEWLEPRSTVPDPRSEDTLLTALCSRPRRGEAKRIVTDEPGLILAREEPGDATSSRNPYGHDPGADLLTVTADALTEARDQTKRLRAINAKLRDACETAEALLFTHLLLAGPYSPPAGSSLRESFEECVGELRAALAATEENER